MPTEILTADQYLTEDWHQLRRNAISASEIAVVLGISPFSTPFALYHAKKDDWRTPVTEQMEMGHRLEPVVADLLSERLGEDYCLGRTGTWRADNPIWAVATPDRLAYADNDQVTENVELKTTESYDNWGPDETDEIPVYYRAQVMWQMYCTGLQRTHVGVLFRGNHFRHYIIDRNETEIQTMLTRADLFMLRLKNNTPPPIDDGEATLAALKRLHPTVDDETVQVPNDLAKEFREAHADLMEAKARKRMVESRLRYLAGSANRIADEDGDPVAKRIVFDRAGYMVGPCVVDQMRSAS